MTKICPGVRKNSSLSSCNINSVNENSGKKPKGSSLVKKEEEDSLVGQTLGRKRNFREQLHLCFVRDRGLEEEIAKVKETLRLLLQLTMTKHCGFGYPFLGPNVT